MSVSGNRVFVVSGFVRLTLLKVGYVKLTNRGYFYWKVYCGYFLCQVPIAITRNHAVSVFLINKIHRITKHGSEFRSPSFCYRKCLNTIKDLAMLTIIRNPHEDSFLLYKKSPAWPALMDKPSLHDDDLRTGRGDSLGLRAHTYGDILMETHQNCGDIFVSQENFWEVSVNRSVECPSWVIYK